MTVSDAALSRESAKAWPRYLSADSLLSYLDLGSLDGVYRLVQSGLPAIRLGRGPRARYRFDRLRVDAWMAEQQVSVGVVQDPRRHVLKVVGGGR